MKKYYDNNKNYIRNRKNFVRYVTEISKESLQKENERIIANDLKYGKSYKLIIEGENDRINGKSPRIFSNEEQERSYAYGYFEKGSRSLAGKFANQIYTLEEQRNFGIVDLINGVSDKDIVHLKQYPAYIEGRIYQAGRIAYDYISENNISFEEYVKLMSIINPQVQSQSFKDGYNSKINELEDIIDNKKHR